MPWTNLVFTTIRAIGKFIDGSFREAPCILIHSLVISLGFTSERLTIASYANPELFRHVAGLPLTDTVSKTDGGVESSSPPFEHWFTVAMGQELEPTVTMSVKGWGG